MLVAVQTLIMEQVEEAVVQVAQALMAQSVLQGLVEIRLSKALPKEIPLVVVAVRVDEPILEI